MNPTHLLFFMEEIFLNIIIGKEDFLSYFCYILNVFTIVFLITIFSISASNAM